MKSSQYKEFHESFMKNNHGSDALHTFLCIFFTVQCTLLCALQENKNKHSKYVHEYVKIVLPLILAHTILAEYIYPLNAITAVLLLYNIINTRKYIKFENFYELESSSSKKLTSISCIRGLTYLITSMCILGVDFRDFPRYLAKTENYGYSLMDTGVGLFVLISGLVHKDIQSNNFTKVMKSNIKFVFILLVLGISRYVSIKQLDYHEHITEYGVHWNFFFTLAVCKLFSTIVLLLSDQALALSFCIIMVHELLLFIGLEAWVFDNSPRLTLIEANREGISSNLGYISLYLFAVHLKKILVNKNGNFTFKTLLKYSIMSILLSYLVNVFRPTSRTLANAGYCLFLISILLTILTVMYILEISFTKDKYIFRTPVLISAVNDNGLLYFLLCNVSTGLVNILFQTMLLSSSISFVILNVYMIVTLAITVKLNRRGIKM